MYQAKNVIRFLSSLNLRNHNHTQCQLSSGGFDVSRFAPCTSKYCALPCYFVTLYVAGVASADVSFWSLIANLVVWQLGMQCWACRLFCKETTCCMRTILHHRLVSRTGPVYSRVGTVNPGPMYPKVGTVITDTHQEVRGLACVVVLAK